MATLSLIPLRPQDLQQAAVFISEACDWAPVSTPNPDPTTVLGPGSVWYSAVKEDAELVGILGFHSISWIDGSADVAMGVVPALRRNGVGHYLAKLATTKMVDLRLRRLTSTTVVGGPSSKICAKAGWQREALFRRARLKDGRYQDVEVFAFRNEKTGEKP